MPTTGEELNIATLKRAIESRDAATLTGFYAEDAVIRVIDSVHPPSAPRELRGRAEIAAYYEDVCGRAMTHHVEQGVAGAGRIAFTQQCRYPEGAQVFCAAMLELERGEIVRQVTVQAWDA